MVKMLSNLLVGIAVTAASVVNAQSVQGAAEGFAAGVTGGGNATPVYPADIEELKALLTSSDPQVIVLSKEYNFIGSEGTTDATVCQSWGTGDGCQVILDTGSGCGDSPSIPFTYDTAGPNPIEVASDKTLIGVGNAGVIRGKGLAFRGGTSNVIVQNIMITELNPEMVWGGDTITFDGSSQIWIDHVHVSFNSKGCGTSRMLTMDKLFLTDFSGWPGALCCWLQPEPGHYHLEQLD